MFFGSHFRLRFLALLLLSYGRSDRTKYLHLLNTLSHDRSVTKILNEQGSKVAFTFVVRQRITVTVLQRRHFVPLS